MKINHEITRKNIIEITGLLRTQATVATNYRNTKTAIENDENMSQKYQQESLAQQRENYIAKLCETKEKIKERLEIILEDELKQETILEYDVPEFSNTLAVIDATQGQLPDEVIKNIKYNFAGQYQVLLSINAAFGKYGIELSKYGYDEYLRSASAVIQELIHEAKNIEQSEVSTFVSLRNLFSDIIKFGEVRGIKFSESEKDFREGHNEEADDIFAKQVMGLK